MAPIEKYSMISCDEGAVMDADQSAAYWMEMADYDLDTVKAMFRTERYLYVGFMAHQAIEKALKSYHG